MPPPPCTSKAETSKARRAHADNFKPSRFAARSRVRLSSAEKRTDSSDALATCGKFAAMTMLAGGVQVSEPGDPKGTRDDDQL